MLARVETLPPEQLQALTPTQLRNLVKRSTDALESATDAAQIVKISSMLDAIEHLMHAAGMYDPDEIRDVVEARIRARWKLGGLLATMQRGHGPGRGKKNRQGVESFIGYLKEINLDWKAAQRAQRLGCLPLKILNAAFAHARVQLVLCTIDGLIKQARPYWYKASREQKHSDIANAAKINGDKKTKGPFPLIYADPPWKFETYSPKGLEKTPDQHYPTLTDQQIINFKIDGRTIPKLAHKDAALLLWCTSSNLKRAIAVMEGWGFTYKTCAVWVKTKQNGKPWTGMGLVFRNAHEFLLYGTKGKMPGPQYQPPSVFLYERGRHSAKPPEIRKEIEKMYPDFDAETRLELFARNDEVIEGWTCRGLEANE
jgi:N6-adenosine-specific RNA methylase IME4